MFETLTQRLSSVFSSLRGQKELTEANLSEGLQSVRTALLEADVHFNVARDFTEKVKARVLGQQKIAGVDPGQQFVHAFHQSLVELLGPEDARLVMAKTPPTVILMAGLQGAGKTTTCGKLARLLREQYQRRPLLVAADIKRPAAVEQLRVLGRQLDIPVFHEPGLAPPELCARGIEAARRGGQDVVILDTAGRLHVDEELMREVAEIAARTAPHDQILVVDAMTGQDAVRSAQVFHERLKLTGVILTKLDGDARGGAAVSLKAVTGCPILYVGTGEKLEDLTPFHPERMAGQILGLGDVVGLVEKAQSAISEREAEDSFQKMMLGSFTLEDQLKMLRMMKRLGPMKKVLGMMPGMGGMLDGVDVDDKKVPRMEALLTAMTPRERLRPEIIEMSRRRRIARGAGQDVGAVNELLKSHKMMGQMMKQMGRMGMASKFASKEKQQTLDRMQASGQGFPGLPSGGMFGSPGSDAPSAGLGGLGAGGLGGGGVLSGLFGGGGAGRSGLERKPFGSQQGGSKKRPNKDKKRKKRR